MAILYPHLNIHVLYPFVTCGLSTALPGPGYMFRFAPFSSCFSTRSFPAIYPTSHDANRCELELSPGKAKGRGPNGMAMVRARTRLRCGREREREATEDGLGGRGFMVCSCSKSAIKCMSGSGWMGWEWGAQLGQGANKISGFFLLRTNLHFFRPAFCYDLLKMKENASVAAFIDILVWCQLDGCDQADG